MVTNPYHYIEKDDADLVADSDSGKTIAPFGDPVLRNNRFRLLFILPILVFLRTPVASGTIRVVRM